MKTSSSARAFLTALLSLVAATASAQPHQPYTPPDDAVMLEHVGLPRAPGVLQLREVRTQWLAEPRNYTVALAYAQVAVEVGRQEDDPRYFGYAESALRPWLDGPQPPPEARLLRASLRQVRKDFAGALQDLDALIAAGGPESAQAQLARAGLRLMQGDPAAALQDCAALENRVDPLLQSTCAAAAKSLSGEAASSLALLDSLRTQAAETPRSVQVWLLGLAAGAAERLGRIDAARNDYAVAQRLLQAAGTRDPALLGAYADCLLEHGDNAAVVELLASGTRIDSLLLRLAVAESRLGAAGDPPQAARADAHAAMLAERFDEAHQRGDSLHLREEAMYQLGLRQDARQALQLAQRNWALQREPIDARVLLRAALAAQRPEAAQPVLEWLRQTHLEDAYLAPLLRQLHAGASP